MKYDRGVRKSLEINLFLELTWRKFAVILEFFTRVYVIECIYEYPDCGIV